MLGWTELRPDGANFAVTDRYGGVSRGSFASLNLGSHVDDDPRAVAENRRRVATAIGVEADRLLFVRQVHGERVVRADGPWAGAEPEGDAIVTCARGLALGVLVADCTPVLLCDVDAGVVAAAHVGRRGLLAGIVPAVLAAMADLGARRISARVGPSICARCYETGAALRDEVADVLPETRSVSWSGTPSLDVAAGVLTQLRPHCVDVLAIPGCSRESDALFSYRRDGRTGRFAGVAWLAT